MKSIAISLVCVVFASGLYIGGCWLLLRWENTAGAGKLSVRQWHTAEVVSVHETRLFHYYEIIASFDPGCRLTYREFRNPLNPLSISVGATIKVVPAAYGVIYVTDERGRMHKGYPVMQALMAKPIPKTADLQFGKGRLSYESLRYFSSPLVNLTATPLAGIPTPYHLFERPRPYGMPTLQIREYSRRTDL